MTDKYILDKNGNPVPEPDLLKWGAWFEGASERRRVAQDLLPNGVRVSTVFLGLDHDFLRKGPPILYETMIFGGEHDMYQERYSHPRESNSRASGSFRVGEERRKND